MSIHPTKKEKNEKVKVKYLSDVFFTMTQYHSMTVFAAFLLVTVVNFNMFIFAIGLYGEVQVGILYIFPTPPLYFNIYFITFD